MKEAEIKQLKLQIKTLQSISKGADSFVARAANSYRSILQLQSEVVFFNQSSQSVSEQVSILRAMEWSRPEDWSPNVYFESRRALRQAISVMAQAERSYRALNIKNQEASIRQVRNQLKTAAIELEQLSSRLMSIQSNMNVLSNHLTVLRGSNLLKRKLSWGELDGKQIPNRPFIIEQMISDLATTAREIHLSEDLIRKHIEQLNGELEVASENRLALSTEPRVMESLEVDLSFFSDFLKLIPTRFRTSANSLSQVVAEEVAAVKTRITFVRSDKSNSEFEKRLQAATKRKAREKDRAREELEKAAKETSRRSLAEFRRAERYLESNPNLESEILKKEKAADSLNQRLTRSRTQLANLESQIGLTIENLWLRNQMKVVATSRGREEINSRYFFQRNLALYPALANKLQRKTELEEAISLLQREKVTITRRLRTLRERAEKVRQMDALLKRGLSRTARGSKRPRRVVTEWTHAEELARDFMVYLGFHDARLTKAGADGGVDVTSRKAVAQVKMHSKGVPSYDVQKLVGIASVERKIPLFFAMSYSREAKTWSNEYGIALFCFDRAGDVVAVSEKARSLDLGVKESP